MRAVVVPRREGWAAHQLREVRRGDLHERDVVQGERLCRRTRRIRLQGDAPQRRRPRLRGQDDYRGREPHPSAYFVGVDWAGVSCNHSHRRGTTQLWANLGET